MAEIAEAEAKIAKAAGEAERALAKLLGEIQSATARLPKGEADPAKAAAASRKVKAYMSRYAALTKLQGSKIYGLVSPEARARIDWVDGVMGDLLGKAGALDRASKKSSLDPQKKLDDILKAIREAMKEGQAPQGVGTLLKEIEKGKDIGGSTGAMISFLPMAIILWMIGDMIRRWLKNRPKG